MSKRFEALFPHLVRSSYILDAGGGCPGVVNVHAILTRISLKHTHTCTHACTHTSSTDHSPQHEYLTIPLTEVGTHMHTHIRCLELQVA